MIAILFETHSTSLDSEAGIASGHCDVSLSAIGQWQAAELGRRYTAVALTAIYCSDLQRAYQTAEIAFSGRDILILRDARLRECDYGELTRHLAAEVDAARIHHVREPFPGGESYEDATRRVRSLLDDISQQRRHGRILIIGHRATYYALEHMLNGMPLEQVVIAPFAWQPGWRYELRITG